jgi:transposase
VNRLYFTSPTQTHLDPVARIAEIGFTSEDRVREVIHNFNRDGFSSLSPKYAGGRPHKFDPDTRSEIARVALTRPKTFGKPYTGWSLSKLADYLVEAGVVDDRGWQPL